MPRLSLMLCSDIHTLKQNVSSIKLAQQTAESSCSSISTEMSLLRDQVAELIKAREETAPSPAPSTELTESIANIGSNLSELTQKISSFQSSMSTPTTSTSVSHNPDPRTSPNTESPHAFKELKTPCEPYVKYEPNAIPNDLKDNFLNYITEKEADFKSVGEGSREVLYFGEHSYDYTGHKHESCDMPDVIKKFVDVITPHIPSDCKTDMNSCLITRYKSGSNHIPLHRDDEPFIDPESHILTISIGASRTMTFENNSKKQSKQLSLDDCSLLITSRYAQDFWKHGILPDGAKDQRISLTFRNIAPYYMNSTIVLGDSNTSKLAFGTGSGTLGVWVPGKRVHVGHIEALPDAIDIGPYRNIVIHTGINSINYNNFYRKSDSYLLHFLENKCKEISSVYPRARIYISMLLPTRLRSLNAHVSIFNRGILDMTFHNKNVRVIDNAVFGSMLSDEHGRWNVAEQRPNSADALHLGRKCLIVCIVSLLARDNKLKHSFPRTKTQSLLSRFAPV